MANSRPKIGHGVLGHLACRQGGGHLSFRPAEIRPKDLEDALATQGTRLRRDDIVLVPTGWFRAFYRTDPDRFFAFRPWVGRMGCATWEVS
jgi:hypothetical protein